jgi:hypothetical protein
LPSGLALDSVGGGIDLSQSLPRGYRVAYRVQNSGQCATAATDSITIYAHDTTTYIAPDTSYYCASDMITIMVLGDGSGLWSASPSGVDLVLPATVPGRFLASNGGQYEFQYYGYGHCDDTARVLVLVENPATTNFDFLPDQDFYCDNVGLVVELSPDVPGGFVVDTNVVLIGLDSISVDAMGPGYSLITFNPDGCYWPVSKPLVIQGHPERLTTSTLPDTICEGQTVRIVPNGSDAAFISWQDSSLSPPFEIHAAQQGDTVQVQYVNVYGCAADTSLILNVFPYPHITISPEDSSFHASQSDLQLRVTSDLANTVFNWFTRLENGYLGTGYGSLVLDSTVTIVKLFPEISSPDSVMNLWFWYQAHAHGCPATSDTILYRILPSDEPAIFIPGAFSPNDDGLNDTWKISFPLEYGAQYAGYVLDVINRAGVRVATVPVTNPNWDAYGLPDGVYNYILRSGDKYVLHGGLTICRSIDNN